MNKLLEFIGHSPATKAFGISLLHSIWQGAAIAAILWIGMKILKNFQAQIRYYTAFLSLLFLSATFCFTFYLQYVEHASPSFQLEEIDLSSLNGLGTGEFHEQKAEDRSIFQQLEDLWFTTIQWVKQHTANIFLLWSVGFVFYSGRFFLGLNYLERLKRSSNPVPQNWQQTMVLLQQKVRLKKNVKFLFSHQLSTPLTFGWLKPVIIFPASVLAQLPIDQVESILLHELIHIRQRDYLISLLQSVTELLFFFNPGYWYISSILNKERENACDDQVITTTEDSITYAKALSRLAELCLLQESQPALAVANHKQQLLYRIKRIVSTKTPRTTMKPFLRNKSYQLAPIGIFCLLLAFFTLDVKGNIQSQNFKQETEKSQPNDTSKTQSRVDSEKENQIFTTISKGYYQISDSDSKGNPLIMTMTSDSITVFTNNSAKGARTSPGHIRTQNINPEAIQEELQSRYAFNDLLYHQIRQKNGTSDLHSKGDDSLRLYFKKMELIYDSLQNAYPNFEKSQTQANIVKKVTGRDPLILMVKSKAESVNLDTDTGEEKFKETIKKALSEGIVIPNIQDIPAEAIVSVTVIKDEAETLFAEKGKNGVIIVTLKESKTKPSLSKKAVSQKASTDSLPYMLVLAHEDWKKLSNASPENGNLNSIAELALKKGKIITNPKEIDPNTIHSMNDIKGEQAKLFGKKGRNGVVIIYLKENAENTKVPMINCQCKEDVKESPLLLVLEHPKAKSYFQEDLPDGENRKKAKAEHALKWGIQIQDFKIINQSWVETVEVLKDEQSKHYGERGKNGVVVIILREGYKAPSAENLNTKEEEDFILYPNPSDDLVKIKLSLSTAENVKITAHDNSNNLLKTVVNQSLKKGTHEFTWDASQQAPGIYIITLVQGNKVMSKKVEIR